MRECLQHLEEQLQHLKEEAEGEAELRLIVGCLETFATKVKDGLRDADFQTRRGIICALVKRAEIDEQHIHVVFRVSPISPAPASEGDSPMLPIGGGVYWMPVYRRLKGFFELMVANAQCIKAVPERKTDVKDAE